MSLWSETVLHLAILLLFFIYVSKSIKSGEFRYRPDILNLFFVFFILYIAFQALFRITKAPYNTRIALETALLYFALFFVTANYVRSRDDIDKILYRITQAGFLVSIIGILQKITSTDRMYWLIKMPLENFFGTFVNQNHFAFYIAMVSLTTLGAIFSSVNKWDGRGSGLPLKYAVVNAVDKLLNGRILFNILALALMLTSLFLSKSRSGMVFFSASAGLFLVFMAFRRGAKKTAVVILLGFVCAYFLLNHIGVETAKARLYSVLSSKEYEGRLVLYTAGMKLFGDYPLFGIGVGSFANIFPMYNFGPEIRFSRHLHNDPLQLLIEMGIIGFVFVFTPLFIFIIKFFLGIVKASDTYKYCIGLAIFFALFHLALNSITDFGMRINAISSLAVILLALAISVMNLGFSEKKRSVVFIKSAPQQKIYGISAAIIFLYSFYLVSKPLAAYSLISKNINAYGIALSLDPGNDDLRYRYFSFIVNALGKGEIPGDVAYRNASEAIDTAIRLNPYRTNYLVSKAYLELWKKNYAKTDELIGKAAVMEPENPRIHLAYAYVLFKQAVDQEDAQKRERLLKKGLAYYRRAGVLSKHTRLYSVIEDRQAYNALKEALDKEGIFVE